MMSHGPYNIIFKISILLLQSINYVIQQNISRSCLDNLSKFAIRHPVPLNVKGIVIIYYHRFSIIIIVTVITKVGHIKKCFPINENERKKTNTWKVH